MIDLSHIKELRRYRGNEKAVRINGDRNQVANVLDNFDSFSRDELTNAIMACYDGELFGHTMWTRKYSAWGGRPEQITVHGRFAEQYPQLSQLNLDTGFLSYLPEFIEYAKKENPRDKDPFIVREKFKEHLGATTLWRGIRLTKNELNSIEKEGIYSSFFRINGLHSLIEQFEANILSVYPWQLLDNQFYGSDSFSPFISVSANKDVAKKVGESHCSVCRKTGESKELYLFELKIPLIDVVAYTDHCLKVPDLLKLMVEHETETLTSNNKTIYHPLWKTNIEQFILYKINADEIVQVNKP
ncbi:MAG: hypothetical protein ABIC91_08515 [Nanoarchaeota archaeon]|nr:hypothetical protein [Nanoarchaeota archaeon]MBU1030321.1 hypothetical protein [Nanoarchaeota archaeon]MBU1849100.1 hypothetical protein [Nanoarchaeota archaeon]